MPKLPAPTSIRLDPGLKKKLAYQADRESRKLSVHIVHILKMATALVKVPKRWREKSAYTEMVEGETRDSE